MKKSDIQNALSGIDDKYLDKSFDSHGLSSQFKREKNKKIRSICAVCCCMVICFIAFGITQSKLFNDKAPIVPEKDPSDNSLSIISQNNNNISVVEGSLDLTVIYKNDIEKLQEKDIVVVAGRVIESDAYYNDDLYMPMTLSKLEVTKNFSNADIPKTIDFFEPGAKLNVEQTKMFVGSENVKDGMEFTLDGYKHCNVGDEVILFLLKGSSYPDLDEKENFEYTYHTVGLIQGKLIFNDGIYKSATPSSLGTEYSEYTLDSFTEFYQKMK